MNWDSVQYPESPFNRHVSPFLLGALVIGVLGYAAWKFYSTPLKVFTYLFIPAAIIVVGLSIYLENISLKQSAGSDESGKVQ
ncbi:hypothetical protein ACFL6N_03875 [Thermodesulfobacteriota bacterium]